MINSIYSGLVLRTATVLGLATSSFYSQGCGSEEDEKAVACTATLGCKPGRVCNMATGLCESAPVKQDGIDAIVGQYDSGSRSADTSRSTGTDVYRAKDVSQKVMKGDVNCDNDVTFADLKQVNDYLAEKIKDFSTSAGGVCLTGKKAADVNCDGDITFADQKLIKDYIAEFISSFPCK